MRTEVTKRIFEIIHEGDAQCISTKRWLPVAEYINDSLHKGVNLKNTKQRYEFVITDQDLQMLTDQQLTELFELVVRRFYIQM